MESISFLVPYLPYLYIGLSIALMGMVVLQRSGASLGGAFGAENFSSGFHARRGFEKVLFQASAVIATILAIAIVFPVIAGLV